MGYSYKIRLDCPQSATGGITHRSRLNEVANLSYRLLLLFVPLHYWAVGRQLLIKENNRLQSDHEALK